MTFFQGTLQDGIATALQQSKSVLCFVTDGGDESTQWENDFLADEANAALVKSEAVALRLEAGSQGEEFLTQLYPIPKKPTIVIIESGHLKEYIASGVSREVFNTRLQKALQPPPASPPPPSPAMNAPAIPTQSIPTQSIPTTTTTSVPPSNTPSTDPNTAVESASSTSSGQATPSSSTENQANIQSFLAERAARLAAQKKKDDEEAKKRRAEKEKAKPDASLPEAQRKHIEQVKRKQSAAREERQRILQAIEDDKAARRARQAEKEALRKAAEQGDEEKKEGVPFAPASPLFATTGRIPEFCALQVRMLDGSTIRSKFASHDSLKDVRAWVDETTKGNLHGSRKTGYVFKILLTPLPSKTVDVTEEGKALYDLGLTPSATLILVPTKSAVSAYASGSAGGNVVLGYVYTLLSFITSFFGAVVNFLSTMLSTAGPPQAPGQEPAVGGASGRDGNRPGTRRVNGRRSEQQYYNGNSVNFEPRPDDEDEQ